MPRTVKVKNTFLELVAEDSEEAQRRRLRQGAYRTCSDVTNFVESGENIEYFGTRSPLGGLPMLLGSQCVEGPMRSNIAMKGSPDSQLLTPAPEQCKLEPEQTRGTSGTVLKGASSASPRSVSDSQPTTIHVDHCPSVAQLNLIAGVCMKNTFLGFDDKNPDHRRIQICPAPVRGDATPRESAEESAQATGALSSTSAQFLQESAAPGPQVPTAAITMHSVQPRRSHGSRNNFDTQDLQEMLGGQNPQSMQVSTRGQFEHTPDPLQAWTSYPEGRRRNLVAENQRALFGQAPGLDQASATCPGWSQEAIAAEGVHDCVQGESMHACTSSRTRKTNFATEDLRDMLEQQEGPTQDALPWPHARRSSSAAEVLLEILGQQSPEPADLQRAAAIANAAAHKECAARVAHAAWAAQTAHAAHAAQAARARAAHATAAAPAAYAAAEAAARQATSMSQEPDLAPMHLPNTLPLHAPLSGSSHPGPVDVQAFGMYPYGFDQMAPWPQVYSGLPPPLQQLDGMSGIGDAPAIACSYHPGTRESASRPAVVSSGDFGGAADTTVVRDRSTEEAWAVNKRRTRPAAAPKQQAASEAVKVLSTSQCGVPRARGKRALRLWAHIHLHMRATGFDLVPMLIGRGGCNVKRIVEATGAKIRVRGRGSGHLEIDGKFEAPTPLMVAVTSNLEDKAGFRNAVVMTIEELRCVEQRFLAFCEKTWHAKPEGPCFSMGTLPRLAEEALGSDIKEIPRNSCTPSK